MLTIRHATQADLAAIHHLYYLNEVQGDPNPPARYGALRSEARHILQAGTMVVAEQEGQVIGYAGSIIRGRVRYLTDLFVHPEAQSGGLGKALLQRVLLRDDLICCTMSSTDPRAQSLYIRSGMQPQWPHFNLRWHGPLREVLPDSPIEVVVGQANDPAVIAWDAEICGRERPQEHAFWQGEPQSTLLWLRRGDVPIGYGYVRIDVPGSHPVLASLLERGFRIVYVETFLSSAPAPFFDARCYIPSGSDLL